MSLVGTEFVLHKVAFPHLNNSEDEFVRVMVEETREVPGYWDPKTRYVGWKALGNDGKTYYCNWERYPDDSMTPAWSWDSEDGDPWYNVTYVREIPVRPVFLDDFEDLLHYCEEHQRLSYKREDPLAGEWCFQCGMDQKYPDRKPKQEPPKRWGGWR